MSGYVWDPNFFREHYESLNRQNEIIRNQERRKLRYLKDTLKGKNNLKIIDLGCGYGRLSRELLPYAQSIIGVDVNQANVDYAKKYVANDIFSSGILDLSNGKLPFEINTIDLVVMDNVLVFLSKENQKKILSEIHRILKVDGLVYFNFPNTLNPVNLLQSIKNYINSLYKDVPKYYRTNYFIYLQFLKELQFIPAVFGETFHVKILGRHIPSIHFQKFIATLDASFYNTTFKIFMSSCTVIAKKK